MNWNHGFRKCPKPRECAHNDCNSSHNTLLLGAERVFPRKSSTTTSSSRNTKEANQDGHTSPSTCAASVSDLKGLLPIAPVVIQVGDKRKRALALCDTACSHSWVDKSVAESLSLNGAPVKPTLNGINSSETVDTEEVAVQITSDSNPDFSIDISPYVKNDLSVGSDRIDIATLKRKFPHLEPINFMIYSYSDVQIILGQDAFRAIRPVEYFESEDRNAPVAVRLPIGWVLSGPVPSISALVSTCFRANTAESLLADKVRSGYETESFGTYIQADTRSKAEQRAVSILESTTKHDGTRYVVGLLWTDDSVKLPDNYCSSLIQFKSLEQRLSKNLSLKEQYSNSVRDDREKGYIIEVEKHDPSCRTPREWYLPHHPVVNPHNSGKVRRVLNGASKFHGHSLNNALLIGPGLLQNLLHVLLRFRQYIFALSADIEEMFLQVGVP